ncbi:MAG: sulfotransferase family protein [Terriglobia bacterium]
MIAESITSARSKAPVFIVGSPRSGNNFLYHTLLSAGGFALYRASAQVFNMMVPKFGDPAVRRNRRRLVKAWLASPYFERTGLDASVIEKKLMEGSENGGEFLRIIMEEMCRQQGARRWATVSVEEILYLPEIKRTIPEALVLHIVRDGRDVALSLAKMGFVRPFPWDRKRTRLVAALYWDWVVRKGREYGQRLGADYMEFHYEDLVQNPRDTLSKIGRFIEHDLDYDRIRTSGVGTVAEPNTSFRPESGKREFNPVGRWRKAYSEEELLTLEKHIGGLLQELGYPLSAPPSQINSGASALSRGLYDGFFEAKLRLKSSPLGPLFVNADTMKDPSVFSGAGP